MPMQEYHLTNSVTYELKQKWAIHYQHEDNDLEGLAEIEAFTNWLHEVTPGQYVLVKTGDYLRPPCRNVPYSDEFIKHFECETYDANYYTFLVPASYWQQNEERLMQLDSVWREELMKCRFERTKGGEISTTTTE